MAKNISMLMGIDSPGGLAEITINGDAIAADGELAGAIEGTSEHQGVAAGSIIISNLTNGSDIIMLVSDAGDSKEFLRADGDVAKLSLGWGMTTLEIGLGGISRALYTAGALAFQEATVISTTTGDLTLTPTGGVIITTPITIENDQELRIGESIALIQTLVVSPLAANAELSTPIEGASKHQATSVRTFVLSNVANDGDILMLISDGGNSLEFLLADADVAHLYLGHGMIDVTIKTDSGNVNLAPAGDVVMGADVFIEHDTNAGLTAGTTQTQADGLALTTEINEVAVVANPNDTVVLPEAAAGRRVTIIHNGANTLRMYPKPNDDLGAGVDVFKELEPNEVIEFVAYDAVNWHVEASTETLHAEMFDTENTDAFVVNAQTDDHMYHTNGLTGGDLAGWTFDAGGAGTSIAINSIADGAASGVDIAVTCGAAHGLAVGDIVSQSNLTSAVYTGVFVVKAIISPTIYEVAAVFTATDTGTMDQAATLICTAGSQGSYKLNWSLSATAVSNNDIFVFAVHVEAAHQNKSNIERKFGIAADIGAVSGAALIDVGSGEHVSFMVRNIVGSGNITLKDLNVNLVRL
jgi:hypothetical protein